MAAGYDLIRRLGKGAFGEVHQATDPSGKTVAVKLVDLIRGRGLLAAVQEAGVLGTLSHPNIVRFIAAFRWRDTVKYALVMEYCVGGDLHHWLARSSGTFDVKGRMEWYKQLSSGLQHIHDTEIVHRDLKPRNILFQVVNKQFIMKIADVGMAAAVWSDDHGDLASYLETFAGTRPFMAPEVFTGSYTKKCDVFSLGLVFACIAEVQCEIMPSGQCLADIVNSPRHKSRYYDLNESAGSLIHYQNAIPEEKDIISRMLLQRHLRYAIGQVVEKLVS
eukprot:m.55372 g.55372  ORF g.55372 m.55372 type:complete len:276 (+) comp34463_c0_seq1:28-855(+)